MAGIAPNLLNRDFYAEKPNQKWVTDVTEFSLFGQKLYLSPILDLHNGYLVSYTISERPVLSMVTTMLDKAFETIPDGAGLILHSDQGWRVPAQAVPTDAKEQRHPAKYEPQRQLSGTMLSWKTSLAYSKVSCSICKNSSPWNSSNKNLLTISIYYRQLSESRQELKGLPPALLHRQQALSAA